MKSKVINIKLNIYSNNDSIRPLHYLLSESRLEDKKEIINVLLTEDLLSIEECENFNRLDGSISKNNKLRIYLFELVEKKKLKDKLENNLKNIKNNYKIINKI